MLLRTLAVVVLVVLYLQDALGVLTLGMKLLGRARVTGRGITMKADSLKQCMAYCHKKPKECDAINYNVVDFKCRLFRPCAQLDIAHNSTNYYFYSRRRQVVGHGWMMEPESHSCLKVVQEQEDYAKADGLCADYNARLVTLKTPKLNDFATTLLKSSRAQRAWIGLRDADGIEGDPVHSDGTKVSKHKFFRPGPQQYRKSGRHNCWALEDNGTWTELSCKKSYLYGICEIPLF